MRIRCLVRVLSPMLFLSLVTIASTMACTLGRVDLTVTPNSVNFVPTVVATAIPTLNSQPSGTQGTPATVQPVGGSTTPTPCGIRSDWPMITVTQGDSLSLIASMVGTSITDLVAANCLANARTIIAGQRLHVPRLPLPTFTPIPTQIIPTEVILPTATTCPDSWFFRGNPYFNPPSCPLPVRVTKGVGEDFEGGRAIWYESAPFEDGAIIYIIYNDKTYAMYQDQWQDGQPENDPSLVPPTNRYQPQRGIGKVWRDNPTVRQKLGWAYEPESPFTGHIQQPESMNCNCERIYVDLGKSGIVLELIRGLTVGTQHMLNWSVVGSY